MTATGGRDGRVTTADGLLDLDLAVAVPTELGGRRAGDQSGTAPVRGRDAACVHSSLRRLAARAGVDVTVALAGG